MKLVRKMKYYLCIDLKSFYASVECVERGLDPNKTDLIVADTSRTKGAICLAISPKMKARGIKNRCRIYEIPSHVHPIVAKPRMRKYILYSSRIYAIYLKYVSKEDIHPYSIDEMFFDITSYLSFYGKNPMEFAEMILDDIYRSTGLTATAGVGTNLYLAKIAMDIIAKKNESHLAFLDEARYQKELWHHEPLEDFWRISTGTVSRLRKLHLKDMYDIAHADERWLYKEFGIQAEFLIDHAWGREPCTIQDIKNYHPKSQSLSNSQILYQNYSKEKARIVLTEMVDSLVLTLVEKNGIASKVGIYIGYSKELSFSTHFTLSFPKPTSQYSYILKRVLEEYDYRVHESLPIRRLGICFFDIERKRYQQLDLFSSYVEEEKEECLEKTIANVKQRFGNDMILRAASYQQGATQKERNRLIGGHNAE